MKASDTPLVSVIIPVYDSEKHLRECVDSILNQEYKNIEIILVDDGSIDDSSRICDEYEKSSDKVRVFHKENGGVSSARNLGIEVAIGEFVSFVDSDDIAQPDMISRMMGGHSRQDPDLIVADYIEMHSVGYRRVRKAPDVPVSKAFDVYSLDESGVYDLLSKMNSPFAKLFSLQFINKNKLRFPEDIRIAEDLNFLAKAYLLAEKIIYVDEGLYLYRVEHDNSSSATGSMSVDKAFDFGKSLLDIDQYAKSRRGYKTKLKQALKKTAVAHSLYALNISLKDPGVHEKVFDYVHGEVFKKFEVESGDAEEGYVDFANYIIKGDYRGYLIYSLLDSRRYVQELIAGKDYLEKEVERQQEEISRLSGSIEYLNTTKGAVRSSLGRAKRGLKSRLSSIGKST